MNSICNFNKSETACYPGLNGATYDIIRTADLPNEIRNAQGELIGYKWHENESIALNVNIVGNIDVEDDAIIYSVAGNKPENTTAGAIGQKAYNIIDLKSWTCTAAIKKPNTLLDYEYVWTEDKSFTYPDAGRSVYMDASDYISGKKLIIKIYNFRYEEIYNSTQEATSQFTLTTEGEINKLLTKGLYYITITLYDNDNLIYLPIIKDKDCCIVIE